MNTIIRFVYISQQFTETINNESKQVHYLSVAIIYDDISKFILVAD